MSIDSEPPTLGNAESPTHSRPPTSDPSGGFGVTSRPGARALPLRHPGVATPVAPRRAAFGRGHDPPPTLGHFVDGGSRGGRDSMHFVPPGSGPPHTPPDFDFCANLGSRRGNPGGHALASVSKSMRGPRSFARPGWVPARPSSHQTIHPLECMAFAGWGGGRSRSMHGG
jgi:hypothetical protein